jgi:hypothetical protein
MTRLWTVCIAAALCAGLCFYAPTPGEAAGGVVTPAALHLPYNAKVQTELNFSNNDVLGLIKELLPAIGELVKVGATAGGPIAMEHGSKLPPEALAKLDLKPLAEALDGITSFRFLAARYREGVPANEVMALFNSGAAKAGDFNRIVTDFSMGPGVVAVYAQPEGAGFIVYGYNAKDGMIRAARLTGRMDVAKLMTWLTDTIKLFTAQPAPKSEPIPSVTPESAPAPKG